MSTMGAYNAEYYDSRILYRPAVTKRSLYGFDGFYSDLQSTVSTAIDEDKQGLLNAVLENFSNNNVTDNGDFGDTILPLGYKKINGAEVNYNTDPLADWYSPDPFGAYSNGYQKQSSFNWNTSTPANCFGTEKAQLYEKLFDSYIYHFNLEPSQNGGSNYLDCSTDVPSSILDSDGWDHVQPIEAFKQLSVTSKPKEVRNTNAIHKIDYTGLIDKGKTMWRKKRGNYKASEKKSIPPLTGQDFKNAMEHLKDVLDSLYRDQIPPTFFNVRSRFVEFDTKNIPVEQIMNICHQRPDVFKVEVNDRLNQTFIYFVTPPSYFKKWIDRNDLTDIYPEEMWNQFLDLLVELVNNPENMVPVFPGSIYGTAKVFQKLELPFFDGMTLGTLCHIVQLAVRVRKLLMYELKTLKPNLVSILQACVNRSK